MESLSDNSLSNARRRVSTGESYVGAPNSPKSGELRYGYCAKFVLVLTVEKGLKLCLGEVGTNQFCLDIYAEGRDLLAGVRKYRALPNPLF